MSSAEVYKSLMGSGLKAFFEQYESSIREFIDDLDQEGLLLRSFSEEQVTRLQNMAQSGNMLFKLANDLNSIFKEKEKIPEKIELLKKAGFNIENKNRIAEHFGSVLTSTYIALLERLKIYFLFFINWKKLGKDHKDITGLGSAVNFLKKKFSSSDYLNYFDSSARNSIAHYTFFWAPGSDLYLCSEIFESNPKKITLVDLMKEVYNVNVLTEGFYILVRDKYGVPDISPCDLER